MCVFPAASAYWAYLPSIAQSAAEGPAYSPAGAGNVSGVFSLCVPLLGKQAFFALLVQFVCRIFVLPRTEREGNSDRLLEQVRILALDQFFATRSHECVLSDRRNAVRDGYIVQPCTTAECTCSDDCDAIRDVYSFQV